MGLLIYAIASEKCQPNKATVGIPVGSIGWHNRDLDGILLKMQIHESIIVTAALSLLMIFTSGCATQSELGQPDSDTHERSTAQLEDIDSESDYDPIYNVVADIAVDFMAKLGYGQSQFRIAATDLMPMEGLLWHVQLEDDLGQWVSIVVNEDLGRMERYKALHRPRDFHSPVTMPGDDIVERVADALGLPSSGYQSVDYSADTYRAGMYRKYADVGEWRVCVGQVNVRTYREDQSLYAIHWRERGLLHPPEVNVDREAAIDIAASYLGIDNPGLLNAELIQLQRGSSRLYDLAVFWEVVFEGQGTVHVRCDDGAVLGAPTVLGE